MSSLVRLLLKAVNVVNFEYEHRGDGYGEDLLLLPFTHDDITEKDLEADEPRLLLSTTVQIARDRLACRGFKSLESIRLLAASVRRLSDDQGQEGPNDETVVSECFRSIASDGGQPPSRSMGAKLFEGPFEEDSIVPFAHALTALLALSPDDWTIELDLSDSDWVDQENILIETFPIGWFDFPPAAVLCEGVFDSRVLKRAITLTHPHLRDFLTVPEFGYDREGSSAALSKLVRGLADAGIRNPEFIVLFDADRAGVAEAQRLRQANLPHTFRIKTLPQVDFLEEYPVVLPTGITGMNIAGWGAAIEVYLAADLNLTLPPLVLSFQYGLNGGYQGVMQNADKQSIQKRFESASDEDSAWPMLGRIIRHIIE